MVMRLNFKFSSTSAVQKLWPLHYPHRGVCSALFTTAVIYNLQSVDKHSRHKVEHDKGGTHGPDVASFGGEGGEGAAGGATGAAAAGGAADGAAASGGGISTCFQSCPSSTMRAMRVPRRTLRLPSSICKECERGSHTLAGDYEQNRFGLFCAAETIIIRLKVSCRII